ncbi:MAG: tRNA lysidine(34) synthetase TilS [Fimbriimonadaceae bacterium]|nr:tRNA lysidine(34) synthetase TilS [Fimbriimonadaceae bacterium]
MERKPLAWCDDPIVAKLRATNAARALWQPNDTILVGYSGGADSTCLLAGLVALGIDVVAAHLHHGMRPEADTEMRLCQAFAEELGIPFLAGRADVPLIARHRGIGLEEAGRDARYAFFRRILDQSAGMRLATGHTRTDSAETLLFHLARGTGMSGMLGVPTQRDAVIRPLTDVSRAETRAFCDRYGLWTHDDPANADVQLSRARIRHRVLPELSAINPQAELAIARTIDILTEEDRFLNGMAARLLEECELRPNGPLHFLSAPFEVVLDTVPLAAYPLALRRRAVRLAVGAVGGELTYEQTELLAAGIRDSESAGSVTCEGGTVDAAWDGHRLSVRQRTHARDWGAPVGALPGDVSDDETWVMSLDPATTDGVPARDVLELTVRQAGLRGNLFVRTANPGDTIQPSGFEGHRKLSDLFGEAGLTETLRSRLPVLCDLIGPVWVPGVTYSHRVRPDAGVPEAGLRLRIRSV